MNELYKEKKTTVSRRRWIYVLSVLIMASAILYLFFPNPAEARLAMVITPEENLELELKVLPDCALKNIYLRALPEVPASGEICTLIINGQAVKISDLSRSSIVDGEKYRNYLNLAIPYDLQLLAEADLITISYCNVNPAIERYDLELVVEIMGNPDSVKNWNEFVAVRAAEGAQVIVVEVDPENPVPGENKNAGEISAETSPAA